MDKRVGRAAVVAVWLLIATAVNASLLVREFKGTSNTTTAAFTVESPWIIDWRLDGDYDQMVALDITLIEAKSGRHVGQVVHTKRKGNGVRLLDRGGTSQLRVSGTLARWTIKIEQLTREEAELYTPR